MLPIPLLEDPFYYFPPIYFYIFQVVSFPQVSPPPTTLYASLVFPIYTTYPTHVIVHDLITRMIFGEEYGS
jgi:hypothetical protein